MHAAFENAGTSKGLEVWRIENFEPVPVDKNSYGKFYTGDSYIVLKTNQSKSGIFSWDIHFWLGLETSQDEAGAAAILSVQLDDRHNGAPVQHREVQDYESQLFLSYFPGGVRYLAGGVQSGFREVETNAAGEKRLFQVKGSKNIRVREVPLALASMNRGDCYILDGGHDIYVYVGPGAKRVEKIKAITVASQIRDQDHAGRACIHILDEHEGSSQQEFFDALGEGSAEEVPLESESDTIYETQDQNSVTLYKVSDADGSLSITPIGQRPLKQSMLDSNDCFILDTGASGIFVWVGTGATAQERSQSMVMAQQFIATKGCPLHTQVHRIIENGEMTDFKQYFASWQDKGISHSRLIKAAMDDDSSTGGEEKEFDPEILHMFKKNGGRALGFMPDNGQGEAEIWRVENFDLVPIEPHTYGMFFGGDSYVIKYEYRNKRGGQGCIIYFWLGKESSVDEKASAAIHAVNLDNQLNRKAVLVRVTQYNEPRHFLKIFKGKLINFTGGKASGFKHVHDHDTYDVDGTRLFRIRGTCSDDVRADQLPETASSLASDDVFILETPSATYLWHGVGASELEKEMAANIVLHISPDVQPQLINEGSEPEEFWTALGGKADYDRELDPTGAPFLTPRLFHCRILFNDRLRVEEVPHFEQDDLNVDDVMVLDGGDEIYVWIGNGATEEERAKSIDMAKQYIKTDPSERNEHTVPIVILKQGEEPRSFKRLFPYWDNGFWEVRH